MTTDKTEVTAKDTTSKKLPTATKRAAKPAKKPAAKKPVKTTPKPAAAKPKKEPKVKMVRDSFSMPQDEYQEIAKIKDACRKADLPVKKSEVLRAGLKVLVKLNMTQIKRLLAELKMVKPDRPKKH